MAAVTPVKLTCVDAKTSPDPWLANPTPATVTGMMRHQPGNAVMSTCARTAVKLYKSMSWKTGILTARILFATLARNQTVYAQMVTA